MQNTFAMTARRPAATSTVLQWVATAAAVVLMTVPRTRSVGLQLQSPTADRTTELGPSAAATATTELNPSDVAGAAMTELGPLAAGYLEQLRAAGDADRVEVRVWMHDGNPKLNGCGFYFRVDGFDGRRDIGDRDFFPKDRQRRCGDDTYLMRMTEPGSTYDVRLRLGDGVRAREAELHADGWHDTFVRALCVGLHEGTVVGGPRAFCVNNGLLKACKRMRNRPDRRTGVNVDSWDDILMTRTARGAQRIVFRDIDALVGGFENLNRNVRDSDALRAVCDGIELVRGDYNEGDRTCPAHRKTVVSGTLPSGAVGYEYKNEEKNPYGCFTPL